MGVQAHRHVQRSVSEQVLKRPRLHPVFKAAGSKGVAQGVRGKMFKLRRSFGAVLIDGTDHDLYCISKSLSADRSRCSGFENQVLKPFDRLQIAALSRLSHQPLILPFLLLQDTERLICQRHIPVAVSRFRRIDLKAYGGFALQLGINQRFRDMEQVSVPVYIVPGQRTQFSLTQAGE